MARTNIACKKDVWTNITLTVKDGPGNLRLKIDQNQLIKADILLTLRFNRTNVSLTNVTMTVDNC